MIKQDVINKIQLAEEGRMLWIKLLKEHNISEGDYVILFPSKYDEWAYYGALYLDDFLESKSSNRAIVLCYDKKIKDTVLEHSAKSEILHFNRDDAEKLLALYGLYLFTDNLIIFSPTEPAGRNGLGIIGKKEITVEHVSAIGIYGLKKLKRNDSRE